MSAQQTTQRRLWAAVVITTLAAVLSAPVAAHSALDVFERADLAQQVDAIGPQIQEAFDAQWASTRGESDAEARARDVVRRTIASAFSADAARHTMLEAIETGLSETQRKQVVSWFESPVGERILRAEQHAAHSDLADFDAYQHRLDSVPPSAERVATITELDRALGATRAAARLLMQFDLAVAVAHQAAHEDCADCQGFVPEFVMPDQLDYERAVSEHVLAHYYYAFRALSEADIKRYTAFATSVSGARYVAAVQRGLERAINSGTWSLAHSLMRLRQSPQQLLTELSL